jgi:hypothetical protein
MKREIMESEELLNSILKTLEHVEHIKTEDIPTIELYMDQVTSFIDEKLRTEKKESHKNRVLTKTMINNYAKNDLLPAPIRKKYTKEHILLLVLIYYFKGVLPIQEIQALLKPIKDRFFQAEGKNSLESIYNEVFSLGESQIQKIKLDLKEKFKQSQNAFTDKSDEDAEFLRKFSVICMLCFDVYLKKRMIEKLLDEL